MPTLELIQSGPIYHNPDPGYRYVFAAFSHPVQLSDQELICAYNQGQALYAADLTFYLARSTDGGTTWSEQALLYDPAQDTLPYSYHSPFLSRMADGELVVAAFRVDRSDPRRPIFNEVTGGLTELQVILLRSRDNGHTWSAPEVVHLPEGMVLTPSTNLVELADGGWLLPCDQWHVFDDPGPYRPRTVGLFSRNRGESWGNPITFADGSAQGMGFWHGRIIRLRDDRLFTLFWSAQMNPSKNLALHRCFGSPDGREWSTPEPTNLPGQTNQPVDLGDGLMAAIYTQRESAQPGFRVALSADGGKSWDLENQVLVWDATGRDRLGVDAPMAYPRSHDTIAFGAPTAMQLADGDLFVSFWCTEMSITHVRYARLRVHR
jgi:sialidase-1